ncbi:MAG: hypothetical protein JNL10_17725 [Verrucomicrobiales bacterium]|nr:hypothetical protein [Verrucomicrobiales bacterium]
MMLALTPGERQVLLLLLFLVVSGIAGRAWIRSHPSEGVPLRPAVQTTLR